MLTTTEFVHALHPHPFTGFELRAPNRAELVISTLEDGHRWCHHWRLHRRRAAWLVDFHRGQREIFFSVALHDSHAALGLEQLRRPSADLPTTRPRAATAIVLPALWVSLAPGDRVLAGPTDHAALRVLTETLPLPPSCVVATGTGFDAYWLLREPWFLEAAPEQAAASTLLRGLRAAVRRKMQWRGFRVIDQDLGEILRFPGSFDRSRQRAQVVATSPARYARAELERYCGHLVVGDRAGDAAPRSAEAARRDLVHGLRELLDGLGGRATSAEILAELARCDGAYRSLRAALLQIFPRLEPGELPSAVGLGRKLHHLRDQAHDGLAIVRWPRNKHGFGWSVQRNA